MTNEPVAKKPRRKPGRSSPLDRRVLGKQRALWVGFLAAVIPLAVLLVLQYVWLADLQKTSTIAKRVSFSYYLEGIAKDVYYFYFKNAERALNVPAYVFQRGSVHKAASFFKKKKVDGAKRLFVVSYEEGGTTYFYDPKTKKMVKPEFSPETLAVWVATAPWKILASKGGKLEETVEPTVDERDPDNRIILNPITDESWKLVGLAGMIVDEDFFVDELLPKTITASFKDPAVQNKLLVSVRTNTGKLVIPCSEDLKGHEKKASTHFFFVFTDWKLALHSDLESPERWARTNFVFNISLSTALAAVLMGGIILALRTTMREMRLSTMKNDFVSNVSHELRTPLSSIRVFGEFMRRGRVNEAEKIREYGHYIETESRRLTQLINNILDFSRIESGRRVYSFEVADLEEVVMAAVSTFSVRLRSSGTHVQYHGPEHPLPMFPMDPGAIDRALCNLLDNAHKYSDGGHEIAVSLHQEDGMAVVSVTDQGVGIPRDEQERIFERFHRVSTGLVHDVKGSGLGLSLVQHIVHAHHGKVTVESEVGKGSTFSLHLPLDEEDERV